MRKIDPFRPFLMAVAVTLLVSFFLWEKEPEPEYSEPNVEIYPVPKEMVPFTTWPDKDADHIVLRYVDGWVFMEESP